MTLVANKKAKLRYEILETFQAGLELSGAEVKSLRAKHGALDGARVIVRGGEAFIVGMSIPPYQASNTPAEYDPERTRRLLLKKEEIAELLAAEERKGLTVVPIEVYNAGRYLKVRVCIVRGRGKSDKRQELRRQDDMREAARELRGKA